jgi:hypothetical protein
MRSQSVNVVMQELIHRSRQATVKAQGLCPTSAEDDIEKVLHDYHVASAGIAGFPRFGHYDLNARPLGTVRPRPRSARKTTKVVEIHLQDGLILSIHILKNPDDGFMTAG